MKPESDLVILYSAYAWLISPVYNIKGSFEVAEHGSS
jgi:hypothetical protein